MILSCFMHLVYDVFELIVSYFIWPILHKSWLNNIYFIPNARALKDSVSFIPCVYDRDLDFYSISYNSWSCSIFSMILALQKAYLSKWQYIKNIIKYASVNCTKFVSTLPATINNFSLKSSTYLSDSKYY